MNYKAHIKNDNVFFKARLSYAKVFEPSAFNGQEPKYSVSLLIDKGDKEALQVIKGAIEAAKKAGADKAWGGKIPTGVRVPIRDGDEDRPDDEVYAGKYFINANSPEKRKPKLFSRKRGQEATEEDIYSGCYAIASVNFYPYNVSGNRGIACGLRALQAFEHGEPLSGSSVSESDFEFDDDDGDDFDDFLS